MEVCANPCDNGSVSVGATSTLVMAANPLRTFLCITNVSDELVSLGFGAAAVANKGCPINAKPTTGKCDRVIMCGPAIFKGAIYGICASGSKTVATCEG